jgi:hypothetical protein|tara:strand:- start:5928 stop:6434 length:507 start_codon:yes stop_codon:yes gene_type:complete
MNIIKRNVEMGRKGNLLDLLMIIGVLFAIIISIYIGKTIITEIGNNEAIQGTAGEGQIEKFENVGFSAFNNMFFIIFIGSLIVTSIIAFNIRTHPAFFPISAFVVLPLVVWISAIISNAHESFVGVSNMIVTDSVVAAQIMGNLPLYMFGFGVVLLLVVYGINKAEGM